MELLPSSVSGSGPGEEKSFQQISGSRLAVSGVVRIEISEDGKNAVITSFANVIWRHDSDFLLFFKPFAGGALFSKKYLRKNAGDSTLYGFIEVIGEEKTAVDDTGGKVARLAKSEQDCPNTLRGSAVIQRVEDDASMTYDAVAIGNFSRGQGSLFRGEGSPYPRLDNCEDTLDQLEFQLSKWEIFGPYAVSPSNQGKTSLIVTFPTKFFHYKSGKRIKQINNPFVMNNETKGESLETTLSEGGQVAADSTVTLPHSTNVIGLYKDYNGSPMGIDNVSLPTYSLESGDVTLTAGNIAQPVLIEGYEYLQEPLEPFWMYRGLPAVGLVLREYRNPDVLHASIIPVEFSAFWETKDLEFVSIPATPVGGPASGTGGAYISYTFTVTGSASSLGYPVQYLINWGDGTDSGWLDPDPNTQVATASHYWAKEGIFTVRARARSKPNQNVVSPWSVGITVPIEGISIPTKPSGPTFMVVNNYSPQEYPFR